MKPKKSGTQPKAAKPAVGRFHTRREVRDLVWIRAAGHCELCGIDLTHDFRVGVAMKWGEAAHILPASPQGPRTDGAHDARAAAALTDDPANLLLACPSCHEKIDRDAADYPTVDLSGLHAAFVERIRLAAKAPEGGKALALILLSQHHQTQNTIRNQDLLTAMSAEGLAAIDQPIRVVLPAPGSHGRNPAYWEQVKDQIQHHLVIQLRRATNLFGDAPALAVAGLADIPALMMLGQSIGDRTTRYLFSPSRGHGLRWPNPAASAPAFHYQPPPDGEGPIALVLSLSATIPIRDVTSALPDARIAEFTVDQPSIALVQNRGVIDAFRDALQIRLSALEALTSAPIAVFAAIPAAIAVEFGALLTMQHQHPYLIYDRNDDGGFVPTLELGRHAKEKST